MMPELIAAVAMLRVLAPAFAGALWHNFDSKIRSAFRILIVNLCPRRSEICIDRE